MDKFSDHNSSSSRKKLHYEKKKNEKSFDIPVPLELDFVTAKIRRLSLTVRLFKNCKTSVTTPKYVSARKISKVAKRERTESKQSGKQNFDFFFEAEKNFAKNYFNLLFETTFPSGNRESKQKY